MSMVLQTSLLSGILTWSFGAPNDDEPITYVGGGGVSKDSNESLKSGNVPVGTWKAGSGFYNAFVVSTKETADEFLRVAITYVLVLNRFRKRERVRRDRNLLAPANAQRLTENVRIYQGSHTA